MRLLGVLLIIGATANDADKYCPSSICWDWDDTNKICKLKMAGGSSTQAHANCATLKCEATEMKVDYTANLFGSDWELADFKETTYGTGTNCLATPDSGVNYKWAAPLGECGIEAARKSGDATMIQFTKELEVTRKVATQIAGTIDIFTSDAMGVKVTFKCDFSTTVDLTTDATITTPIDVTGDVTISTGTFDAGINLKIWVDNTFEAGTEVTTPQTIGTVMYASVVWDVLTLSTKVGFYLDHCKIEERAGTTGAYTYSKPIYVIKDTCFANVVEATPVSNGQLQYVANNYYFTYKSFAYSTSGDSVQRLTCQVVFCTHEVNGNALDVDTDCAGMHASSVTKKTNQAACETVADDASYDWTFHAKAP